MDASILPFTTSCRLFVNSSHCLQVGEHTDTYTIFFIGVVALISKRKTMPAKSSSKAESSDNNDTGDDRISRLQDELATSLLILKAVWHENRVASTKKRERTAKDSHVRFLQDVHKEIVAQQDKDSDKHVWFLLCKHRYPHASRGFLVSLLDECGYYILSPDELDEIHTVERVNECEEADAADACKWTEASSICIRNSWHS